MTHPGDGRRESHSMERPRTVARPHPHIGNVGANLASPEPRMATGVPERDDLCAPGNRP